MAELKEVTGFVRVERDALQGFRSLKTIKSFWPGDVVLREKPMVECAEDTDAQRLLQFLELDPVKRQSVLSAFTDVEVRERGCEVDPESLTDTLVALASEGVKMDKREAAHVLGKWRYASHIDRLALYEKASTLRHSCAANVDVCRERGSSMMTITARFTINPQTRIGAWLIGDTSIWWKGANVRSEALQARGLLAQECCCERCLGEDPCRAINCPGCTDFHKRLKAASTLMLFCGSATVMACFVGWRRVVCGAAGVEQGEVTRNGKLKRWRCTKCDFNASDTAVEGYLKIEVALVNQLSDLQSLPPEQLRSWASTVEARMGGNHWLVSSLWREIFRREVDANPDGFSFVAVLATIRLCEWFQSRNLTKPPVEVVDELGDMMFRTMTFLNSSLLGVRDLRVLYLRAIDTFRVLIESLDKSMLEKFKPFAGTAQNLRRRCGFCSKFLKEDAESGEPDICADDTGRPTLCSVCMDLGYCGLSCQLSDSMRHKPYCIPMQADFKSRLIESILLVA